MALEKEEPTLPDKWKSVSDPRVALSTPPFMMPPLWAAEVGNRLTKRFPAIPPSRHPLYLRALTHPSFAPHVDARDHTMVQLVPIGTRLLDLVAVLWSTRALSGEKLAPGEWSQCVAARTSDEALSVVMVAHLQLADLILTDSLVDALRKHGKSAASLQKWLQHEGVQRRLSAKITADATRAIVAAWYLDHGLESAAGMVVREVLPYTFG